MRHQSRIDRFLAVSALIGVLCVSIMYSMPIGRCFAAMIPAEKGRVDAPVGKVTTDLNAQISTANVASSDPTGPTVTSVSARQRTNGSHLVDIYYSVTSPTPALVRVDVSIDNMYSSGPSYLSGEFGSYILPGGQRHVVWDAGAELGNVIGCYRARVRASETGNYWNYNERVSSYFSINNGSGVPSAISSTARSSYSSGTTLLRGQLHNHSYPDKDYIYDNSGTGYLSNLSKYCALGYDFLAITDHNIISQESVGWQGWAPNSVEITHGNFLPWAYENDTHVLAIGTSQGTTMNMIDYPHTGNIANDTAQRIQRVHNRSGLAFVAHPDSKPYNIGVDDLVQVYRMAHMDGVGIWTPGNDSGRTFDRLVYALGRPVWGYVEDDYHPDSLSSSKKGRSWVAVPGSPGEWWGNIKEKLCNGDYYCYYTTKGKWPAGSTPPQMHVTVSNSSSQPLISVNFDRVIDSIEFYGYDWGFFKKLKSPVCASSDTYQATGREKFVRVEARYEFSGGTLCMTSQPIIINKNGNFAPYSTNGVRAMSMSPELTLSYVDADNKPIPPQTGYVGDVFDVTTADGQLPPAATLSLSFDGEDLSALGGTQYLAIYRYNDDIGEWVKIGGTVDFASATIESPITQLGKYCISADLSEDSEVPEVVITAPQSGATISQNASVTVNVNDNIGAWKVSFYMNDHFLYEDADASDGWSATIPYTDYCTGDYTLKAVAEDLAGNRGEAEVPVHIISSTPRPTVTITNPSTGSLLSGITTATGTCWDDVAVATVTLRAGNAIIGVAEINGSNWTCDIDTSLLANGNRTLTATVEDYPGNSATASVPVVLNGGVLSTIGSIKAVPDGQSVEFGNAVVVAASPNVTNGFYAETLDRSSGIRVITNQTVYVGDIVSVAGTSATENSERVVNATDVAVTSSGNELPQPLFVRGSHILTAPDSIGKIIKVFGRVGEVDSSNPARWFMLNDPSGVSLKCLLPEGVTMNPNWESIPVTGVASFDESGTIRHPKLFMISPGATVAGTIGEPGLNGDPWVLATNQVVESPHTYPYNYYNQWTLSGPAGTRKIRAHFSQIQMYSSDYLYVGDPSWNMYESFGGSTYQDKWSNWINGDKLQVYMQTYSSGGYGFKLDKYEAELPGFTPLQGIEVALTPGGRTASTLADGTYRFDGLPAGSYMVTPSAAGKTLTPSSRSVTVTNNQLMTGVDFVAITNSGRLRGVVTQRTYDAADYLLESAHPYPDNYNYTWTVGGPTGAARIRVHFTKIELESGYDFLYVKNSEGSTQQTFNKGTPFFDTWSNWVDGNSLIINLVSDSSINYYGFQIDKYEVEFQNQPLAGVTLTLTPGNLVSTSLADGAYSFDSLAAGSYVVTPSLAGATFAPANRSATIEQNQDLAGLNFLKN